MKKIGNIGALAPITSYRLLTVLLLFAVSLQSGLRAQSLRGSAPSTVGVGEQFRVQYTLSDTEGSSLSAPSFAGFNVLYGPSTSTQSSIQIINGNISKKSSVTYSYILSCDKAGTYTIEPASITSGGKTLKSQALKITVVDDGSAPSSRSGNSGNSGNSVNSGNSGTSGNAGNSGSSSRVNDLFMTATASRTNVYEQEAILITYKVYTLVQITQLDGKLPTLDGFQIQEIPLPRNKTFELERYNGRNYNSVIWAQYVVFPQKAGKLTIPAITYTATELRANRALDPFDAFFNGVSHTEVKRKVSTPAISINVSALPEKPAGFTGAVGTFSFSSSLTPSTVKENDAITYTITLKGRGNMKLIGAPSVPFPKDFETYDAKVSDDGVKLTKNGLAGTKTFEYLAIPRHKGSYTIPAAEFTYFDTSSHTYRTLTTEPYTITVEKGIGSSGTSVNYGNKEDVAQLATDILFIKTGRLHGSQFSLSAGNIWVMYLLAIIAAAVAYALISKRRAANADVLSSRQRRAYKIAKKRLKKASKLLAEHRQGEFYDEVLRAMWNYVSDKTGIPQSELNRDNAVSALQSKGVAQENIDQLIKCLDDCEFARYAPGNPNETMETVFKSAMTAISKIVFVFAFLFFIPFAGVASAQTKQLADSLYTAEEFEQASAAYLHVLSDSTASFSASSEAALWYNLGNCYYKLDSIPQSVLCYERAHLLDPGDGAIRTNLALARAKTVDKVTPASELFFITWWRDITNLLSLDLWLLIGFIAFALALALALAMRFFGIYGLSGISGKSAMAILIAVFILANLFALTQYVSRSHRSDAIVMAPAVTVKASPSESSTSLFVIHEGSKVQLLDVSMKEWTEIRLEEGKQGWVQKNTIEKI